MDKIMKLIFIFIALQSVSCNSDRDLKNEISITNVNIGMTANEVRMIMGSPDKIIIPRYNNDEIDFLYLSPFGYSDDFHIFLSKHDSVVIRISDGH